MDVAAVIGGAGTDDGGGGKLAPDADDGNAGNDDDEDADPATVEDLGVAADVEGVGANEEEVELPEGPEPPAPPGGGGLAGRDGCSEFDIVLGFLYYIFILSVGSYLRNSFDEGFDIFRAEQNDRDISMGVATTRERCAYPMRH